MLIFKSEACKEMIRLSQTDDLSKFAQDLNAVPFNEIDSKFSIRRSHAGLDNGTYAMRVSALGRVFHDGGSSDIAALLIEKGAQVTQKMAEDLLSAIFDKCVRYHRENVKPMDHNLSALVRFASDAGINWDNIKVSTSYDKKKSAACLIERLVGKDRAQDLGLPVAPEGQEIVPGEPTARVLKRKVGSP